MLKGEIKAVLLRSNDGRGVHEGRVDVALLFVAPEGFHGERRDFDRQPPVDPGHHFTLPQGEGGSRAISSPDRCAARDEAERFAWAPGDDPDEEPVRLI